MKNKKYSSETIQALMENEIWSFWRSDWTERILIKWDISIPVAFFIKDVERILKTKNINYERSLSSSPVQYKATLSGLEAINS